MSRDPDVVRCDSDVVEAFLCVKENQSTYPVGFQEVVRLLLQARFFKG
jgi:hypothetical protein